MMRVISCFGSSCRQETYSDTRHLLQCGRALACDYAETRLAVLPPLGCPRWKSAAKFLKISKSPRGFGFRPLATCVKLRLWLLGTKQYIRRKTEQSVLPLIITAHRNSF